MRFLLALVLMVMLSACSRNGSLLPKDPGVDVHLPELNLALSTNEDQVLSLNLISSFGISSDDITLSLINPPPQGTLTVSSNGELVFTPPVEYSGVQDFEVEFFYKDKSIGNKTIALSTIEVDDSPVATDAVLSLVEDDSAVAGLLSATDVDSASLTYSVFSQGTKGTVVITDAATGAFEYLPFPNANGSDSFSFRAFEGNSYSNAATVSVTITPVNDSPVTSDFTLNVVESVTKSFNLVGSDVDGDVLTYTITNPPTNGVLVCVQSSCDYTSFDDATGDVFEYEVSDGTISVSAVVTVDVAPVNNAPVSSNLSFSTDEDTLYQGQLPGSDSDGPSLSFILETPPSHGTLNLNTSTGEFEYTPALNYFGSDSFVFKVSDGLTETALYTTSITVDPVDDAPTASNMNLSLEQNEEKGLMLNASDIDSTLSFSIVTPPSNGNVVCVDENCTYTPNFMFSGNDSFVFEADDGTTQVQATVSITVSDLDSWWNPAWQKRRKIPLNNKFSTVTQESFMITLDSSFVYADAKTSGEDIRVTNSSGTLLPSTIDSWNQSGRSVVFVRSSVSANSSNDYLWMYYKNSAATTASSTGSFGPDVTSRLSMSLQGSSVVDDISGVSASVDGATSNAGLFGSALLFNQTLSTDVVVVPSNVALGSVSSSFSLEFILQERTRSGSSVVISKDLEYEVSIVNGALRFQVDSSSVSSVETLELNDYAHVVVTFDGALCKIYIDGVEKASGACSQNPSGTPSNVYIGNNSSRTSPFNGVIEEVKLFSKSLSPNEILSSYRNFMGSSTLVASEQSKGSARINHLLLTIDSDGNDGTVSGGILSASGVGGENFMGDDGVDSQWSYFRFQLPQALASNVIISRANLKMMASGSSNWNSGSNFLLVVGDKTSNASSVSTSTQYPGGATGAAETLNQILWGFPGLSWTKGYQSSDDVSSIVQEIIDDSSGLSSGAHIQLWVRGAYSFPGGGSVQTKDYSSVEKTPAQLLLEW